MGRIVKLDYQSVTVRVSVDLNEKRIVNAHIDWAETYGVLASTEVADDDVRAIEMEARAIVDSTPGDEWPRISP